MSKKPDSEFTARTLLAMRHEVQTQVEAAERIRLMFNALSVAHGVESVAQPDAAS
jgi:hypothetical protein